MDTPATSLHEVERALHESEARLQQVLDNSSALVFAKDRCGRYLFVNREFERIAARPAAEIIGRPDGDVFPPDIATRFRYNDLRVLHEKRAIEFEESGDFGGGSRTYLSSKFPLFDADGAVYAVCGIATDITERKHLEDALSSAALAVSTSEEETLYRELVRYLATIVGACGAFIATFDPADPCRLHMCAFYLDGRIVENFAYPITGTPCELVVGQQYRCFASRLVEHFPLDSDFHRLGVESYAGYPLNDAAGRPRGLISIISRKPLERPAFVESVLRIFAVRASAEIDRARASEALRASEASYREIFEASEDAIYVHDWDTGAIVDVNPRACDLSGFSHEELLRSTLCDISACVPPYTNEEAMRWIEQAKRDGVARFEWQRRNKDGSLHWDEVVLRSARIAGRPRVLAFTRDITERKASEAALRASEEQYRAIFNASVDGLLVEDAEHRIVDVNDAYLTMHGYSREELVGRHAMEVIPAELHARCEVLVPDILAGKPCHIEAQSSRRDGRLFDVDIHGVPMQYQGRPHVLVIMRDMTEPRRAVRERIRLEAQLRQAQKMEAIGQLTGGIAHDFNNLLTSIMGYVALAAERQEQFGDARLEGYLAQAQRSCERARDLIQQMLMFSRGQRGESRPVSVGRLVKESLQLVRATLPATVELETEIASVATTAQLDPLQLEQVLLNLCINARDAIGGPGTLRVTVRPMQVEDATCAGCRAGASGDFVELCVEDSGHGMSPEIVERIFEPFYSTKETGKGTGMGLAIVHGIVHEHGGHVVVESAPGRGSRFRVLFPALPGESEAAGAAGTRAAQARVERRSLEGSVLVVDDEESVGEFMRELLDNWGMRASCVSRPQEALEAVMRDPARFDVVITDQSMPRMTGLQLARALHAVRADLPVILYTGYSDGLAQLDVDSAGLVAVLRKPVEAPALRGALEKCRA